VGQATKELYADRIGHGIRAVEDSRVLKLIRERNVALEVCLTSNLQTGVVYNIKHHPLMDLFDLGIHVTLNTDDPTVSDLTLTDEFEVAFNELGVTYYYLRQFVLNAAKTTFLTEDGRKRLVAHFEKFLPLL
jgi:adenosine deaminase